MVSVSYLSQFIGIINQVTISSGIIYRFEEEKWQFVITKIFLQNTTFKSKLYYVFTVARPFECYSVFDRFCSEYWLGQWLCGNFQNILVGYWQTLYRTFCGFHRNHHQSFSYHTVAVNFFVEHNVIETVIDSN